jgi:Spy/CpxP family protein refolding chaperone
MFGFVIGTLCFIALIKVARHGGGGWGYGSRRRWMLRRLFYRLDTTPGQEKLIEETLEQLQARRAQIRSELKQTQADLAGAFRGEAFDDARLRSAFERHDRLIEELRTATLESFKKVHEALRPEQRSAVAELIEDPHSAMGHGGGCGGHRRSHCGGGGYRRFNGGPATVNL